MFPLAKRWKMRWPTMQHTFYFLLKQQSRRHIRQLTWMFAKMKKEETAWESKGYLCKNRCIYRMLDSTLSWQKGLQRKGFCENSKTDCYCCHGTEVNSAISSSLCPQLDPRRDLCLPPSHPALLIYSSFSLYLPLLLSLQFPPLFSIGCTLPGSSPGLQHRRRLAS